jgi:hypothetical protein
MMRLGLLNGLRSAIVIALLSMFAIPGASAFASDPLLSGYAGPGGGEQVQLGGKLLPRANGNGGLRQSTQSGSAAGSSSVAPGSSGGHSSKQGSETKKSGSGASSSKPVYPNHESTASGLPLGVGNLAILLTAAGITGLIAFFLRRNGSAEQ